MDNMGVDMNGWAVCVCMCTYVAVNKENEDLWMTLGLLRVISPQHHYSLIILTNGKECVCVCT